jgi:hypothetical protein
VLPPKFATKSMSPRAIAGMTRASVRARTEECESAHGRSEHAHGSPPKRRERRRLSATQGLSGGAYDQ